MAEDAAHWKEVGNTKFKGGEFAEAVESYTKSIEMDATQHLCFSNRSAAYVKLAGSQSDEEKEKSLRQAVQDADACIDLMKSFAKGYSRKQAALQELKLWEEAAATCRVGIEVTSDETLKKNLLEVQRRHFEDKLRGPWHGTVSDVLGGYDQEMDFIDSKSVKVEVLGRAITGSYWLECPVDGSKVFNLNIQVPMADVPPGMPPPPPVPYIARIDDSGLHICCPYMKMERPTEFDGPGYCLMKSGKKDEGISEVANLTKEQKLAECTVELISALPDRKLEEPSQTQSEDEQRETLMAQVRFESAMYATQKKYTEEIMKEVLEAARYPENAPTELAKSDSLKELRRKLIVCGILDDSATQARPAPQAAAPPATSSAPPAGRTSREVASEDTDAPQTAGGSSTTDTVLIAVAIGTVIAAGAAFFLHKRRQK